MADELDEITDAIFKRHLEARLEEVRVKYSGEVIERRKVFSPAKQEHNGEDGLYTCLIASSLNCARALGIAVPANAEAQVLTEVTRDAFGDSGRLRLEYGSRLLESLDCSVEGIYGHPEFLVDALVAGKVAVVVVDGHAKAFSGIAIDRGAVAFVVHDPLPDKPIEERLSLADYIEQAYGKEAQSTTWIVTKK